LSFWAACLLAVMSQALPAAEEGALAAVGAWNLQGLGSPQSRPLKGRGVAQDPKDIADYIAAAKLDILCLEGITDDDDDDDKATFTNKTLAQALAAIKDGSWTYRLFAPRNPRDTWNLTGIAWNEKKARPVGEPCRLKMSIPSYQERSWRPWATAMKFSFGEGKTDVVLIPICLRQNSFKKAKLTEDSPAIRQQEAELLVKALPQVREAFQDEDIILMGDFNFLTADEAAITALTEDGFKDAGTGNTPTDWEGKLPSDRAFVPGARKQLSQAVLTVVKHPALKPEVFAEKLSERYIVRISFPIGE
jgi:hypothetical protein